MKCDLCSSNPTFICPCTNCYFCDVHLGTHLHSPGNHPITPLQSYSPEDTIKIKSELLFRIQAIIRSKAKIALETKKFITLIKNCAKASAIKLDNYMSEYLSLFNLETIYTVQRESINKAFTSAFRANFDKELNEEYIKNSFAEFITFSEGGSNYWPLEQKVDFVKKCIDCLHIESEEIRFSYNGKYAFNCNYYIGKIK